MGWIGLYREVKYVLRMYGCDFEDEDPLTAIEDEHGVREPSPAQGLAFFMNIKQDNNDVVVGDNVRAFVNGNPAGTVASYLNSTSSGVRNIIVI